MRHKGYCLKALTFNSETVSWFAQCPGGEIGRRTGLKILRFRKGRAGSSPARGTILASIRTITPSALKHLRFTKDDRPRFIPLMTMLSRFDIKLLMQKTNFSPQSITMKFPGPLVTSTWLAANLFHPNLIVLDASMKPVGKPNSNPDSKVKIPGALVFDFDKKVCDQTTSLPHMMPSAEFFEQEVRALGINPDSVIIIYDRIGVYSSPRARWMFKAMGHDQVAVLDGGLPAWIAEGHATEEADEKNADLGQFNAYPRAQLFCDIDHVAAALNDPSKVVLDARSKGRFNGDEPEPRAGLRSGHMPNSLNLPFDVVQANGRMLPVSELNQIFSSLVKPNQKIIASCGSGVTACIIAFAAELAGYVDITVYDGSWSEWGMPSSRPVVK